MQYKGRTRLRRTIRADRGRIWVALPDEGAGVAGMASRIPKSFENVWSGEGIMR